MESNKQAASQHEKEEKDRKKVFAWWWLLIPLVLVGGWLFFSKKGNAVAISSSPKADIKLCYVADANGTGHCCAKDLTQVSIFESNSVIHLTVGLPKTEGPKPVVTGKVFWETGEDFPAKPINMTLDETIGDVCYSGIIQPLNGIPWSLKKYKIQILVNGQPVGEKLFEIVR